MGHPGEHPSPDQPALPGGHLPSPRPMIDRSDTPALDHAAFRWIPIRSLAGAPSPTGAGAPAGAGSTGPLSAVWLCPPTTFRSAATSDLIDFRRDEVFGIFNRKLELIAMAHLAYLTDAPGERHAAEFGVSVSTRARGRGYGARLFDHAVLHARNRHVDTMIIHALSENSAMLRIARNAGATVIREGSEAEARLKMPPETFGSHLEEMVEGQAAEFDYQLKSNVQRMDVLLNFFSEVREGLVKVRKSTIE